MENFQVYRSLYYLFTVRNAASPDRKRLRQNITNDQLFAVGEVAMKLTNGHINPLRRDTHLFQSRRLMLRTLSSPRVSVERKKRFICRYHSVIHVPSMLKSIYLVQTIVGEVITTIEA